MRWTPGAPSVTIRTESGGPELVVDHDELDAIAHALAKRAADVIREHLHETDDEQWCPLCQIESLGPPASRRR